MSSTSHEIQMIGLDDTEEVLRDVRRPTAISPGTHAGGAENLVPLDRDHPGFRDGAYRSRRDSIARKALAYRDGDPVPRVRYVDEEHAVWRAVWEKLTPLHARYACREYRECREMLHLPHNRIPQLSEINAQTLAATGFRMLPVAGLVSSRVFLGYLARSTFLSTQYIRHHSAPLYTPEPDVVHELVGHAMTLAHPAFTELSRRFGEAALLADDATLLQIERVYWYTLEFGVVEEKTGLKVLGAGLLSSSGEISRFEKEADLRPMDFDDMAETPYDPTDYQRTLFVANSFPTMVRELCAWLRGRTC